MESKQVKIYVAGGWSFRVHLQQIMNQLKEKGFNVVSNWPSRENGIRTPQQLEQDAKWDILEVLQCDVLIAIMDNKDYPYRGTFTEIGCSIGANKRTIIVCPGEYDQESCKYTHDCMNNLFYFYPNIIHVNTLEEAIKLI